MAPFVMISIKNKEGGGGVQPVPSTPLPPIIFELYKYICNASVVITRGLNILVGGVTGGCVSCDLSYMWQVVLFFPRYSIFRKFD